jgi:peptide deformylase
MDIITAPHPTLREKAQDIKSLDKKSLQILHSLKKTLQNKQDPPGVGLAGPQVNKKIRAFAIRPVMGRSVTERGEDNVPVEIFVNPKITKHSSDQVLGENEDNPDLEGCLSIPKIYGPVPRWDWIELEYQLLQDNQLKKRTKKFQGFPARIVQHELDHLNGILFTDYIIKYNLPAYMAQGEELVEMDDRSILDVY